MTQRVWEPVDFFFLGGNKIEAVVREEGSVVRARTPDGREFVRSGTYGGNFAEVMPERRCAGCGGTATTTVDQWRGSWEIAVLPACAECAAAGVLT